MVCLNECFPSMAFHILSSFVEFKGKEQMVHQSATYENAWTLCHTQVLMYRQLCVCVCTHTQVLVKISQTPGYFHIYTCMKVCPKIVHVGLQRTCIFECQFDSVSECAPRSIFICE